MRSHKRTAIVERLEPAARAVVESQRESLLDQREAVGALAAVLGELDAFDAETDVHRRASAAWSRLRTRLRESVNVEQVPKAERVTCAYFCSRSGAWLATRQGAMLALGCKVHVEKQIEAAIRRMLVQTAEAATGRLHTSWALQSEPIEIAQRVADDLGVSLDEAVPA